MSSQEQILIDNEEYIQINKLNKIGDIKDQYLMLIDDGVSSCHAITYANFFEKTRDKIFKNNGLEYFKEVIKDTIATELINNEDFINKAYNKLLTKILNDDSSSISNIFSQVKSRLTNSMSSSRLNKSDYFVTTNGYGTLQKSSIPEYLLGPPSDFTLSRTRTTSSSIAEYDLRRRAYVIDMTSEYSNQDVILRFYSSDDDKPIYLDILVDATINASGTKYAKRIYTQYASESGKGLIYYLGTKNALVDTLIPLFQGWYIQKRGYSSSSYDTVPRLVKL
ncbi:DUF685 domain-containing protein [Borrelia hispanica]|uniref:DUF685 domain-containing protein n=1 Tax=Borrelia hispanica TaxID=40835 RepID=UPI0004673A5A|nr:DUF685 domain-containing protein [Borrelia hispanica]